MAFVLDALVGTVVEKLVDKAIESLVSILGVKSEIKKLQRSMEKIRLVLVDAESKKIESKAINLWFAQLREVIYDAEDLLDDFHVHKGVVGALLSINREGEIGTRIEEINSTLERLTSQTSILQLLASQPNADKKVCHYNSSRITDTCSIQLDSEIVGLDDDAKKLVDLIIGDPNHDKHSVFAITGMGGIGKTTLARKVFNHELIKNHFDNKTIWVCVSSSCSGEYLLKEIVRSIENNYNQSGVSIENNYNQSGVSINELSSKVIHVVNGKKVFIILDDIWDADLWENFLRIPLLAAEANDSRILITTRNQEVAKKMNAAYMHPMTEMLLNDCWSMLSNIVFEKGDDDMKSFEFVGKEIVKKCKVLPLAIKVVGGVLKMTDRTIAAWEKVLSSRTWSACGLPEDVLPCLLLSYEDLPSHLKQCFIYCSLFPQDYIFYQVKLQYMWIAEGFIQKEEGLRMEESAEEYYNELLMRNLLQVTPDHSEGNSKCKMHDLLHSLALFVSQNQYIYVDPKTFRSSGLIKRRHLWFSEENMNVVPKEIMGQDYVRTFMFSGNTGIKTIPRELLSGLKRLRVLDLEGIEIETLPDSVSKLIQLRFLNISSTKFKQLPDSIQKLNNLETLMVSALSSHSLPKEIVKLSKLRHLLVSDTLHNMPNELHKLKNLRVLSCFVVNRGTRSCPYNNMKDLKDLSQLTDLTIYHLERIANKEEAEEAAMENKPSLKCLKLHCKPEAEEETKKEKKSCKRSKIHYKTKPPISAENFKKIEEVFAGIKIPQKLIELSIDGFFGKQFPAHMIGSHLRQVKSLKLERCESLEKVPSLGDMPKLETLHITNLSSVADFDSDFVGELKFPKLRDFRLVGMKHLMKMFEVEQGAFPCLVNLHISNCPKLKSLGEGLQHATCLKKMTVRDVSELESIENLSSITELEISRNSSLRFVRKLPSLKKMDINECSTLKVVQEVRELSSLSISADVNITSLPEWLKNTIASENWLPTVRDSDQELVSLTEEDWTLINKRVEIKINDVKVDSNSFRGASSSSVTVMEADNNFIDEE